MIATPANTIKKPDRHGGLNKLLLALSNEIGRPIAKIATPTSCKTRPNPLRAKSIMGPMTVRKKPNIRTIMGVGGEFRADIIYYDPHLVESSSIFNLFAATAAMCELLVAKGAFQFWEFRSRSISIP